MIQLRELDLITYRAALAFHFSDAVTNQLVRDGLLVEAWPFIGGDAPPVRQIARAEKSPQSALYGFRSLPGLEGYQIGDEVAAGSLQFVVQIADLQERYLPQIRLVNLPLAEPAVQEVLLFSSATRAVPSGYATMHGAIRRTTAPAGDPPEISVTGPASWAQVTLNMAGTETQTYADASGTFVGLMPFPPIPVETLLSAAEWPLTISVAHDAAAITADLEMLTTARTDLDPAQTPPFQSTLESQAGAVLFDDVTIVDAGSQTYTIIGPTDAVSLSRTYRFGRPLVFQTSVDGGPEHLSELLIQS